MVRVAGGTVEMATGYDVCLYSGRFECSTCGRFMSDLTLTLAEGFSILPKVSVRQADKDWVLCWNHSVVTNYRLKLLFAGLRVLVPRRLPYF